MMRDLRLAFRTLRRQPAFTALAVTILALGLGAAIAMFSLMNTLLLRPMPYPEADRLVRVYRTSGKQRAWPHSVPNFLDQRAQNTMFTGMAAFSAHHFNLAHPGQPAQPVPGLEVTADFFPLLGVQPALGRWFLPEEDQPGRNQVIAISHDLWQARFGGDPRMVGRSLRVDGATVTVVAVMPAHLDYPMVWGRVDLWRPIAFTPAQRQARANNWLEAIGRLGPGVTLAQAQAEMSTVAGRLEGAQQTRAGLRLVPLQRSGMDETATSIVWLSMGLALLVLLIACVNLAGLQLSRLAGRAHELAIRSALGASRRRLVSQGLAESLLLALAGAGLGILLASAATSWLARRIVVSGRTGIAIPLDGSVLAAALVLALVTAVVVGLVPAWSSAGPAVADALRRSGRGTTDRSHPRLRQGLVVVEVALAVVLLMAGGLFLRGLQRFVERDPGWRMDGLLTARLEVPAAKYPQAEDRRALHARLLERLTTLPGAERSALSWALPITLFPATSFLFIEGQPPPLPGQEVRKTLNGVSPDYFATLGIPLMEGRAFNAADGPDGEPVVIVNEALARQYWPGGGALGKRMTNAGTAAPTRIVGVVGDVRLPAKLSPPVTPFQVYRPLAQDPRHAIAVTVRGPGAPEAMGSSLRAMVADLDGDLPLHDLRSARAVAEEALANFALTGWILLAFAGVGLVLAALGVYGLFSSFVVQRTREIGVRVALGAGTGQVLWLVLGKGSRLAVAGALLGLGATMAAAPVLRSVAAELPASEPLAVIGLALVLVAVALFACWLPARRAARLDPMVALRTE